MTAKEPETPACVPAWGKEYVRVHASLLKFAGVVAYLVFVTGLGSLCVSLSRHVGTKAARLAVPYVVSNAERPPTLVERRQIEARVAVAPSAPEIVDPPAVLEVPGLSAPVLAAQLDVLERQDLVAPDPRARRAVRTRVSRAARPVRVAAADYFGRSFGVLLKASR